VALVLIRTVPGTFYCSLPILVCGVHFDRTPYIRRVVRTLAPRWTGRGSSRGRQVVRKNIWDLKTALNLLFTRQAIGPTPTDGCHGDKLKFANLFGRERKTGDDVRPWHCGPSFLKSRSVPAPDRAQLLPQNICREYSIKKSTITRERSDN
jgi:hypothetical protein